MIVTSYFQKEKEGAEPKQADSESTTVCRMTSMVS